MRLWHTIKDALQGPVTNPEEWFRHWTRWTAVFFVTVLLSTALLGVANGAISEPLPMVAREYVRMSTLAVIGLLGIGELVGILLRWMTPLLKMLAALSAKLNALSGRGGQ